MKIVVYDREDSHGEGRHYLTVEIDGETVFEVHDGEPEDNTLMRNFNDCFKLPDLLLRAFEAGKLGTSFDIERKEETW